MDLVIRIIWNHHESATQKKVEFEIWIIWIFHFFVMNITMFSCLFYFTEPFSVSLEPQQVKGRRLRLRQSGSGRWGCQQIFQGRLEHMKYWWFCCCGVDATHEIFKRGSGYTTLPREFFGFRGFLNWYRGYAWNYFEGYTLITPAPK